MSCCRNKIIILKHELQKEHLIYFINAGFIGSLPYERGKIFYAENVSLTITSPYGTKKIAIYCRIKNCDEDIETVNNILTNLMLI